MSAPHNHEAARRAGGRAAGDADRRAVRHGDDAAQHPGARRDRRWRLGDRREPGAISRPGAAATASTSSTNVIRPAAGRPAARRSRAALLACWRRSCGRSPTSSARVGPFQQALCGADIALWDAAARRAGQPLADFIRGGPSPRRADVYATNLPIMRPAAIEEMAAKGHTRFKFRVPGNDPAIVERLRDARAVAGDAPADGRRHAVLPAGRRCGRSPAALAELRSTGWRSRSWPTTLEPTSLGATSRSARRWRLARTAIGWPGFRAILDIVGPDIVQPDITKTGRHQRGPRYLPRHHRGGPARLPAHVWRADRALRQRASQRPRSTACPGWRWIRCPTRCSRCCCRKLPSCEMANCCLPTGRRARGWSRPRRGIREVRSPIGEPRAAASQPGERF